MIGLAFAALLAAPSPAADAPKPKTRKPAPAARAAGRITAAVADEKTRKGRITVADDAGHLQEFVADARTLTTCDGARTTWQKSAGPQACALAVKIVYDPATKRVSVLELKSARKADADEAKTRPNVSGEVAGTDVIGGKISVRLGGGATLDFLVGPATKVLGEAEGKPAAEIPFESVKVGDRADIRSADMKTADEIRVRPAAR